MQVELRCSMPRIRANIETNNRFHVLRKNIFRDFFSLCTTASSMCAIHNLNPVSLFSHSTLCVVRVVLRHQHACARGRQLLVVALRLAVAYVCSSYNPTQ